MYMSVTMVTVAQGQDRGDGAGILCPTHLNTHHDHKSEGQMFVAAAARLMDREIAPSLGHLEADTRTASIALCSPVFGAHGHSIEHRRNRDKASSVL